MSTEDSISKLIQRVQSGSDSASGKLFEAYFERLVRLARRRLEGASRRVSDEEDIAVSALNSVFRGMESGRYSELRDRDGLWRLLVRITEHKVLDEVRRQKSKKRGAGKVRGESVFFDADGDLARSLAQAAEAGEESEFVDRVVEETEVLMERLEDENLRQVALLKLEGLTTEEIAARINRTHRTVQRRIRLIQEIWSQELTDENG